MTTDPNSLAYDAAATVHRARQPFPPGSGSVTNDQPGSISIDDLTLRFSKQDVDEAYDRGLTQGLMHAVEHISRLLGHEVVLDISREAAEGMLASALDTAREQGRREAAAAVRAADTSGWPGGRQGEVDACQEIAANIAGGTDAA